MLTLGILKIVCRCVSIRVLELMLELIRWVKHIWLQLYLCDRVTWNGGAFSSQCLKGPHEDQVLDYSALVLDDACVYV